jgi:hypothetical protein
MSVDENTPNWKIRVAGIEGVCIRFDSENDNPNQQSFDAGKGLRYPFLPKPNDVALARKELGELNPQYWRKFRGFWPPADADDSTIVSDNRSGMEPRKILQESTPATQRAVTDLSSPTSSMGG